MQLHLDSNSFMMEERGFQRLAQIFRILADHYQQMDNKMFDQNLNAMGSINVKVGGAGRVDEAYWPTEVAGHPTGR